VFFEIFRGFKKLFLFSQFIHTALGRGRAGI
jgi:hypothetical protein